MRREVVISLIVIGCLGLAHTVNASENAILGGIGTGKIEILPDGRFGEITVNHNPNQPIRDPVGCFAAVAVESANETLIRKLYHDANDPQAIQKLQVKANYPSAQVDYEDDALPVKISLHAYSPLIPGDVENSCYPAVMWIFSVNNPGTTDVGVTLGMSWRNWIGLGGTAKDVLDGTGELSHQVYRRDKLTGILYQQKSSIQSGQGLNALGDHTLAYLANGNEPTATLPQWQPETEINVFDHFLGRVNDFIKSKDAVIAHAQSGTPRPAAAVAARQVLKPGETRSFVFLLAWYMPHWVSKDGTDYGVYYTTRWNSIQKVVDEFAKQSGKLEESIRNWEIPYTQSSFPAWLIAKMKNGMSTLARDGVFLANGKFSMLSSQSSYPGNLGSPEERLADSAFFLQNFPDLLRNELDSFTDCQLSDGEIPCAMGNIYNVIGNGNVPGGFIGNPDSTAAYVLLVYQYYLWTGDKKFLEDKKPHIRYALRWLMNKDRNGDMIPDGISLWPSPGESGTNLFTGSLAMAAYRIGEELEQIFQDLEFQGWCRRYSVQISRNLGSQLWNGNYYNFFFDASRPTSPDSGKLIPGLIAGEAFAVMQGWKSLLPSPRITKMIQSLANSLDNATPDSSVDSELARQYGFDPAIAGPMLLRYGYPDAASKLAREDDPHPELAWWAYASALSGITSDMHRHCLIIGPILDNRSDSFTSPFSTPSYSGTIRYTRSPISGQQECTVQWDRVPRGKEAGLQQIAFLLPVSTDVNEMGMLVTLNGKILAGQDFSREFLRVFGFQPSLKVKPGDSLSLLLTVKDGPRIVADVQARETYNYGSKCRIDRTGLTIPGISFYVTNLLRERQLISLDLINPVQKQEYAVFVNGEQKPYSVPSPEPISLVLPQSQIASTDAALIHSTALACQESAVRFASLPGMEDLKRKLWAIQEEANRLVELDASQRGIRFDVIPTNVLDQFKIAKVEQSNTSMQDDLNRLNDLRQKFIEEIQKGSGDPTLASELTGYFVPIALQVSSEDIFEASSSFQVTLRTRNPLHSPIIGRVALDAIPGWNAITQDETAFDDREGTMEERVFHYSVNAPADLGQKRFTLSATLSGTWNGYAFRKSQPVHVGHDFIHRWLIVGPFANERGEGFGKMNPPEINIKTKETYSSLGQEIGWKEYETADGYVDFDSILTPNDNTVAYAYTSVYSPREQAVQIRVGCNGDLKLFMNYKEIYAKRNVGHLQPGSEVTTYRLYEGWNHLVVKVSEQTGPWGFYLEIYDMQGNSIEGMQFALDKADS